MPSISGDVIPTVVYGTTATIIGIVTVYQSYLAWRLWREHHPHNPGQSSQDVELALGSARVAQQAPSSTATVDVVPTQDMNDVQAFANQVTASVSPRPLGPSTGSTADPESVEVRNDQDAAGIGITPNDAFALPLQPPEPPDVVPVQDTTSTLAVANPEDPSVSFPALNSPDVPASPSTPVHSTDGS